MNRFTWRVCIVAAAGLFQFIPALCADDADFEPDRSFFRTYYLPPERSRPDRVYRGAVSLLNRTQELPEKVVLSRSSSPGPVELELPEKDDGESDGPGEWKRVSTEQIVPSEKRAFLLLRAGRVKEARRLYRNLSRNRPEDSHLKVMLAACEARCGNRAEARCLLKTSTAGNKTLTPWIQWIEETDNLHSGEEKSK